MFVLRKRKKIKYSFSHSLSVSHSLFSWYTTDWMVSIQDKNHYLPRFRAYWSYRIHFRVLRRMLAILERIKWWSVTVVIVAIVPGITRHQFWATIRTPLEDFLKRCPEDTGPLQRHPGSWRKHRSLARAWATWLLFLVRLPVELAAPRWVLQVECLLIYRENSSWENLQPKLYSNLSKHTDTLSYNSLLQLALTTFLHVIGIVCYSVAVLGKL